jgi:hypothetical protein
MTPADVEKKTVATHVGMVLRLLLAGHQALFHETSSQGATALKLRDDEVSVFGSNEEFFPQVLSEVEKG